MLRVSLFVVVVAIGTPALMYLGTLLAGGPRLGLVSESLLAAAGGLAAALVCAGVHLGVLPLRWFWNPPRTRAEFRFTMATLAGAALAAALWYAAFGSGWGPVFLFVCSVGVVARNERYPPCGGGS